MIRSLILLLLQISSLTGLSADYVRFEENGRVGLKDNSGNVVLPPAFDALGWSDGSFSMNGEVTGYRKQNRWGLLNLKKEFVTEPLFEALTSPGGDKVIASREVRPFVIKFGCVNLQGKVLIPFQYDEIKLHDLRAVVMIKEGVQYRYGLIDFNNNIILQLQYQKIEPLGSLRFVVENFNNISALCSEAGKWITDFTIDHISDFQFGLAIIHQDWRCGIIDRNGEIKVEPAYREIKITSADRIQARSADEWRVINLKQEILCKVESDEVIFGSDGWNRVRLNNQWGFIDERFIMRWPFIYDQLGPMKDNHVVAKKDGKYRLLRADQSEVLSLAFDSICTHGDLVRTLLKEPGKNSWTLYDTFGIRKTTTAYEFIDRFKLKFFPAKKRGFWGGVNRYGEEQVACVYDTLLDIRENLVVVKFKGQYGIITTQDEWKVPPQSNPIIALGTDRYWEKKDSMVFLKDFSGNTLYFTSNPMKYFGEVFYETLPDGTVKEINPQGQITGRVKSVISPAEQQKFRESEGLTGISRDGKFGFVDSNGRLRIANRYDGIGEFHEGISPAKLMGKWGYINTSDEIVIQPTYDQVQNINLGVAVVTRKGKSGIIDLKGQVLLELRYDSIIKQPTGSFIIVQGELKGLADHQGKILIEARFEYLEIVGNEWVVVKQGNRYGLLTMDGLSILPTHFSNLYYFRGFEGQDDFLVHLESEWKEIEIK